MTLRAPGDQRIPAGPTDEGTPASAELQTTAAAHPFNLADVALLHDVADAWERYQAPERAAVARVLARSLHDALQAGRAPSFTMLDLVDVYSARNCSWLTDAQHDAADDLAARMALHREKHRAPQAEGQ